MATSYCDAYDYHRIYGHYPWDEEPDIGGEASATSPEPADIDDGSETVSKVVTSARRGKKPTSSAAAETKDG